MTKEEIIERLEKQLDEVYLNEPKEVADQKFVSLYLFKRTLNMGSIDGKGFIHDDVLEKYLNCENPLKKISNLFFLLSECHFTDLAEEIKEYIESSLKNGETNKKIMELYDKTELDTDTKNIINEFGYKYSEYFDLFSKYVLQEHIQKENDICDVIDTIIDYQDKLKQLNGTMEKIHFIRNDIAQRCKSAKGEYLSEKNILPNTSNWDIEFDSDGLGKWFLIRASALRGESRCAENQICTLYENQEFKMYSQKAIVKTLNGLFEYEKSEMLGELDESTLSEDLLKELPRIKEAIEKAV